MRRLTPHLGNLLSANQFFDTLRPRGGRIPFRPAACLLRCLSVSGVRFQPGAPLPPKVINVFGRCSGEPDRFGGDGVPETAVVLDEQQRRLVFEQQLFDLHAGKDVDVVERLVPDIQMRRLAQAFGQ